MFKLLSAAAIVVASALCASSAPAAPLEDYGRLPAVEIVELSPSGGRIAYVGALKGQRNIVVLEVGGKVLAATPIVEQAPDSIQWAGEDIIILRTHRTIKGFDNKGAPLQKESWLFQPPPIEEITAIDLAHQKSHSLAGADTMRFFPWEGSIPVRKVDGRWYAFLPGAPATTEDRLAGPPADLYHIDLETGEASKVAASPGKAASWTLDAKGAVVAWASIDTSVTNWVLRSASSDKVLRHNDKGYQALWTLGLGRTADSVVIGQRRGKAQVIEQVRLDGSAPEPLGEEGQVHRLWFDPNTDQLIGYTAGDDQLKVTLFDPKAQARVQTAYKAFEGYDAQLMSASADFARLVVKTVGKDDPGTFWLVNLTTGKADVLGMSAPVSGKDYAPVSTFDYKAADGLALHGVLTLPAGGGRNLPVVVIPTAAGSERTRPQFDWWAQAFASRGYAVFQPNPRGVIGFSKTFHDAGRGELGRKMISDVTDGVAALVAAGIVDRARVCLVGADLSGYSALSVLAKSRFPARCTVAFAAPTNLKNMLFQYYWEDAMTGFTDRVNYEDMSPYSYNNYVKSPVMFIHPKQDTFVPPAQSEMFASVLKKAGGVAELVEIDGSDHFLWDEQTRIATLKASVAFVEKYNPAH